MPDTPTETEQIVALRPRSAVRRAVYEAWERGLEQRDENNIPVGCPLDRVEMLRYAMGQLESETFDPCADCQFLVKARLDASGQTPVREQGEWFDNGFCAARPRGLVLVSSHPVSRYARKVLIDDADHTDEVVLDCIDRGLVSVSKIAISSEPIRLVTISCTDERMLGRSSAPCTLVTAT